MTGRTYRYMKGPAQYPFGFRLTYADVRVTDARLVRGDGALWAEARAENLGQADTGDVVQVYVRCLDSRFAPPNPSLRGFERVFLKAGEACTVRIPLAESVFSHSQ